MNKKLEKKKKKAAKRDKKQQLYRDRPHSCDECDACCFVFAQGDKPPKVMCCHQKCGCEIYETRPQLCKDYQCTWLLNKKLSANLRPDRCGFIITPRGYYQDYEVLTIEELKNGEMNKMLLKHVTDWLIRIKAIIIVIRESGEEIYHKHCGLMDAKAILTWLHGNYDENKAQQKEELGSFSFLGASNDLEK